VAAVAAPGAVGIASGTAKHSYKQKTAYEMLPDTVKVTGKDRVVGEATSAAAGTGAGAKAMEGISAEQAVEKKETLTEEDIQATKDSVKDDVRQVKDKADDPTKT